MSFVKWAMVAGMLAMGPRTALAQNPPFLVDRTPRAQVRATQWVFVEWWSDIERRFKTQEQCETWREARHESQLRYGIMAIGECFERYAK